MKQTQRDLHHTTEAWVAGYPKLVDFKPKVSDLRYNGQRVSLVGVIPSVASLDLSRAYGRCRGDMPGELDWRDYNLLIIAIYF